jgi:predicted metal-dependent peptidase
MPTQRAARVAIRRLVQQLRSAPEEQWGALVAQAVQMENAIYHYASQVTIRYAVKEGGADDVLAQRIIAAIDTSGLVPQEVPRG